MRENEKLAHEFAIALLPQAITEAEIKLLEKDSEDDITVTDIYLKMYCSALDFFNRQFPKQI